MVPPPPKLKGSKMATTIKVATVATPAKAAAPQAKAKAATAPQAPRFVMGPWPVTSQGTDSIRGYCYSVAKRLGKAYPNGFTAAQYASALAANAEGTTYRQPSAGWGTAAKPNGNAMSHAKWFGRVKQGWLVPAPAAAKA